MKKMSDKKSEQAQDTALSMFRVRAACKLMSHYRDETV